MEIFPVGNQSPIPTTTTPAASAPASSATPTSGSDVITYSAGMSAGFGSLDLGITEDQQTGQAYWSLGGSFCGGTAGPHASVETGNVYDSAGHLATDPQQRDSIIGGGSDAFSAGLGVDGISVSANSNGAVVTSGTQSPGAGACVGYSYSIPQPDSDSIMAGIGAMS